MAITIDKIISAGSTVASLNNVVLSNANGMSAGINGNTVTFSYSVPTDYISTAQSSLFQQTSGMSAYQQTSGMSAYQQTSLMSNYLGTTASLDNLADVVIGGATVNQILKWNGANWINGDAIAIGAGNGVVMFFDESPSGVSTYETIAPIPDADPEVDESVTVNNNTVLIHGYSTTTGIGRTTIDAGVWDFNFYSYVSNTTGDTTLVFNVYSRTSGGTETLLFSAESDPINDTSITGYNFSSVQPSFTVNDTDYLVIKVYGKTTALINIDVHFVHSGTVHYSHVHTPLFPLHNDLAGLQGGGANEYFHLNSADYSNRNISATSVYQLTANMSNYLNTSVSSEFQQTSLMSNYLGTTYTSHTHSQYINTSQSSLFQQTSQMSDYQATSLMSNYLGTTYTSHTHSEYVNTSQSSLFQQTSNTSAITSNALNTSQSSLFQQTSLMSNYLNTSQSSLFQQTSNTSAITSNALNTSQSSLFQQTSLMSNYLGTAATQSFRFTSADSQLQFTSGMSDYQATSLMSNYLGTAATQSFRFTSADSQLQFTSAMSNYLGTTYTSHTHSQYINTSVSSNFLTSQTVQPVAASGSNGSFAFSTLSFGNSNGFSFYTTNGSIVGSYTDGGGGGGGIVLANSETTFTSGTVYLSNAGGISINSTTGQSFILSAPAQSSLSVTGNLEMSISGSTITLGVPSAGGNLALTYDNRQLGSSTNSVPGQNSVWLVPMYVGQSVHASTGLHMVSLTGTVTSNQTNTVAYTWQGALYQVTGTNSSRYDSIWSTSLGFTFWNSGTASVSYSYNVTSGSSAGSNLMTASVYGLRQLTFNIGSTLSPGDYAWGFRQSSASTGNSTILRSFNAIMDNPLPTAMGFLGSATNASIGYVEAGTYSVTSGAMPASFLAGDIRQTLNAVPYFKMGAI